MKIRDVIKKALHEDSLQFFTAEQNGQASWTRPDWMSDEINTPQTQYSYAIVHCELANILPEGACVMNDIVYPDMTGGTVIVSWYENGKVQTESWEYVVIRYITTK